MVLWLVFALMTAAAVFAVLWPLARRTPEGGGSDLVVYRDQLEEIDRDRASGLIGEAEAGAAKIEVSRRLIAAADAAEATKPVEQGSSQLRRRLTAATALVLLPAGAVALYLMVGSPQLPGEPLQARLRAIHGGHSVAALVARVEDHLAHHPDDARGYAVLAPVYLEIGRFDEAVNAYRRVLALSGETAKRLADLGEALTAQASGVVTAEAKSEFTQALKLDPNELKAQFFTGMAAKQDGDKRKAIAIWQGMLKKAPAGAPWVATVKQALASVKGAPSSDVGTPGPSAADMAAASQMSAKDRDAMIKGMVARLAGRLKQNGSDPTGWLRLVRSYRVLGESNKAQTAIADARHALANEPTKLKSFNDGLAGAASVAAAHSAAPASAAPGPSAADIAAASKMSAQDRSAMINSMVARLADRLKKNGGDIAGWQRLLSAYMVLDERDKAQAAAGDARRALASDPEKLHRIEDTIKSLGLAS